MKKFRTVNEGMSTSYLYIGKLLMKLRTSSNDYKLTEIE